MGLHTRMDSHMSPHTAATAAAIAAIRAERGVLHPSSKGEGEGNLSHT